MEKEIINYVASKFAEKNGFNYCLSACVVAKTLLDKYNVKNEIVKCYWWCPEKDNYVYGSHYILKINDKHIDLKQEILRFMKNNYGVVFVYNDTILNLDTQLKIVFEEPKQYKHIDELAKEDDFYDVGGTSKGLDNLYKMYLKKGIKRFLMHSPEWVKNIIKDYK